MFCYTAMFVMAIPSLTILSNYEESYSFQSGVKALAIPALNLVEDCNFFMFSVSAKSG